MSKHVQSFFDFIRRSPSAFHAADTIAAALKEAGYVQLNDYMKMLRY